MANADVCAQLRSYQEATMSFARERTTVAVSLSFLFQIVFLLTVPRTNASVLVHDHSKNYSPSLSDLDDWMHDLAMGAQDDEEWGMVQRKGNQFMVDGQPFYVNGFNTYWLMTLAVDQSTRAKVTDVLQQASMVGLTVCRTWAFSDGGWRALQKSPGIYDEDVFKALDFVVSEARRYKIRLILPLINNWEGYGGKGQYVQWGNASGLNLTSDDDFFSDPTVKKYYKAHVNVVLNRVNTFTNVTYKDDPTIFAWELMNEPECPSDPSGDKLQAWIQEMAFYVKSIDSMHLLGTGAEGFYGSSTPDRLHVNPDTHANKLGTDFIRNHQVIGIDYASAHIYPDIWLTNPDSDAKLQFLKTWMLNHIDDADNVLGMPIVFGEFGVSSKSSKIDKAFRNTFIDTVYKMSLNSMKRGGSVGGCLLWQLFPEGTEYMDDGYAVVLTKSPGTANLLALQSKRIQKFNSKCSWRCHWSCKRRNPMDASQHDEL